MHVAMPERPVIRVALRMRYQRLDNPALQAAVDSIAGLGGKSQSGRTY
jgi:hypothetical protein